MKLAMSTLTFLVATIVTSGAVFAQRTNDQQEASSQIEETAPETEARDPSPDWDAIRTSAERYVAAYNAGDAAAVAELYTQDAELVDAGGTAYRGRAVIAEEYAAFFKEHPGATLQVVVENLTFVSPTVAIEDGTTESRLGKDQPPSFSRFVAVHVKQGDRWRLASVRDQKLPGETAAKLDALTWMVGRWVDEAPESKMEIDCYQHESGSYLMRDFEIKIEGLLASSGTERIGWDPLTKQFRSWLFDSAGGYLEGTWVEEGEQWTVTAQGFRADGEPIHATYEVTPLREDAYYLHAFHRTAGQVELEDFEMTIVRRPPVPGEVPTVKASSDKNQTPEAKQE